MSLEDHLGDIIRKGRLMSNIALSAAARAAGLTEAELAALEDSGQFSRRPDFAALADAIGLNAEKLESVASGWLPLKPELSRWRHFQMITSAGDGMTVNSFLIWDATTREAVLFDTGFDAESILAAITAQRLQLRHVCITHSHHDHVHALGTIRAAQPQARVRSHSQRAPAEQRLQGGETIGVGSFAITFRETPGHAADGVTYLVTGWPGSAHALAIVGDAIFAGSMGRGNDSWDLARRKVREEILTLPPETLLCPGHGPLTTVAEEQAHNPFF